MMLNFILYKIADSWYGEARNITPPTPLGQLDT